MKNLLIFAALMLPLILLAAGCEEESGTGTSGAPGTGTPEAGTTTSGAGTTPTATPDAGTTPDTGPHITPGTTPETEPPKVVSTTPEDGAENVDSATAEIKITFSHEMNLPDTNPGAVEGSPEFQGAPELTDAKTLTVKVRLKPNTKYAVSINQGNEAFRSKDGRSVKTFVLKFTTGSAETPEQPENGGGQENPPEGGGGCN